jgi:hypothetical protein
LVHNSLLRHAAGAPLVQFVECDPVNESRFAARWPMLYSENRFPLLRNMRSLGASLLKKAALSLRLTKST